MILGDLWIGRWVTHDSFQINVPWFIRLPILLVILFFGPVGLFFFLYSLSPPFMKKFGFRPSYKKKFSHSI